MVAGHQFGSIREQLSTLLRPIFFYRRCDTRRSFMAGGGCGWGVWCWSNGGEGAAGPHIGGNFRNTQLKLSHVAPPISQPCSHDVRQLFELWRACLIEIFEVETVRWIYRGALEVLLRCVDVAIPSNARSAQLYDSN
jgi:hypothetical protein